MNRKKRSQFGFTLIELMVTIAVVAIIVGIAAPSFDDMIRNNRLTTQINELAMALNLARSEAVKRSDEVTVCRSNDQASCSGNWVDGWIVFEDANSDGVRANNETIIMVHDAITNNISLTFGRNRVTYDSEGHSSGFNGTFSMCDDRGINSARGLVISNTGRVRVAVAGTDVGFVCP